MQLKTSFVCDTAFILGHSTAANRTLDKLISKNWSSQEHTMKVMSAYDL
jgi:hypothetical protein